MINKHPLISVVMPVRNGERFIRDALDSILSQSIKNLEILVINDASEDQSSAIVKSYNDFRIRLINNNKKLGLAKSRQKAVSCTLGEYIAFLDCDDIARRDRLEKQISYLENHPKVSLVGSWVEIIEENGRNTGRVWRHATCSKIIPSVLLFRNCFTQSAVTLRKKCFDKLSFRCDYWAAPDYDLWTRLNINFYSSNLGEVLTYYRIYKGSMSFQKKKEVKKCTQKIFFNNLKRLGFTPSKEEISIHYNLERDRNAFSLNMLNLIEKWLKKISRYNQISQIYPVDKFNLLVGGYWFKACCLSASRGLVIWEIYRKSYLFDIGLNNRKKYIFLYSLCMIRKSLSIDITTDRWRKIMD